MSGGRARRARRIALAAVTLGACTGNGGSDPGVQPGRDLAGLTEGERGRFLLGRALFERLATEQEGLGPLFNGERCSDCHDSPAVGGGGTRILVRKATRMEAGRCDPLERVGGDNIQQRATRLLTEHGLGPEEVPAEASAVVDVIAPPLFGLGLLEAVADATLEALEDPRDEDGDGISGRLPRLADGRGARFGRKGDAATVSGFIDTALRFELGLTTPEHPVEETRNGAPLPAATDPMAEPEMDAQGLGLLTDFVRFLGPPARQAVTGPAADSVARGQRLFDEIGCAGCHVPELRTGAESTPALSSRTVRAFSDLLLHDLGGGEGDVCGRDAAPGEYRTAPLWGLRHRELLMHDGSASDARAALAAHGGEADASRRAFDTLDPEEQAALLRFLDSL